MKHLTLSSLALSFSLVSASVLFQPAYAMTSTAEQEKLRIHTGIPKRTSDALFSYTAEWRVDDGQVYRASGLSFLNGAKIDSKKSSGLITKKLVTAMKDGLVQLDPNWRGVTVYQMQDQPEMTIANKAGHSLTSITIRDYTNQALRYDLVDKSFNSGGVQVAIDLVLSADVEYLDGFTSKKSQTASQGDIEITIDDQKPVHIKTDGKNTRELEEEIARQLSFSQLSGIPLLPDMVSKDTRNNKPFDGSEVQLLNFAAKSIAIDISDPAVGVLIKFKFNDENHYDKVSEPKFVLAALAFAGILAAGYFWFKNGKKWA